MKKALTLLFILIMAISFTTMAYAANIPASVEAGETGNQPSEGAVSEDSGKDALSDESIREDTSSELFNQEQSATGEDGSAADENPADEDSEVQAEAPPVKEKFALFGFSISNIITTLLVIGVFVAGIVTKKKGKW